MAQHQPATGPRPKIDTTVPHPARRYDYWLGGKDNFAADRESGDAVAAAWPAIRTAVIENRAFLRRAVTFLAGEAGIRQFLDIGTGIPTPPNVHEVAQGLAPAARVVYVDNDPLVLAHARALMTGTPQGARPAAPGGGCLLLRRHRPDRALNRAFLLGDPVEPTSCRGVCGLVTPPRPGLHGR